MEVDVEDCHHTLSLHTFSDLQIAGIRSKLIAWYRQHRRMLPWRGDPPPYNRSNAKARAKKAAKATEKGVKAASRTAEKTAPIDSFFSKSTPASTLPRANSTANAGAELDVKTHTHGSDSSAVTSPLPPSPSLVGTTASPSAAVATSVSPYGVWVSEIMCQQTRVETVIDYWLKWMDKFPTVHALAAATLEEVNAVWAGLGYYRRAKFLHQGAQAVVASHGGVLPGTVAELKQIKGIGDYTAGAIASIAFGQRASVLDGNVIRVLSRHRAVATDAKNRKAIAFYWQLAARLVDPDHPGEFNQAVMELGASVCTPKVALCQECPISEDCRARSAVTARTAPGTKPVIATTGKAGFMSKTRSTASTLPSPEGLSADCDLKSATPATAKRKRKRKETAEDVDVEQMCTLCDDDFRSPTIVTDYPRPTKKKELKEEHIVVCVVVNEPQNSGSHPRYLVFKRPDKGLLAGQWEFPSVTVAKEKAESVSSRQSVVRAFLEHQLEISGWHEPTESRKSTGTDTAWTVVKRRPLGEFEHLFSHRRHQMTVDEMTVEANLNDLARGLVVTPVESPSKTGNIAKTAKKQKTQTEDTTAKRSFQWVSREDMESLGLTTGVVKCLQLMDKSKPLKQKKKEI